MRNLIYSMQLSLDGFIAGPNGEADWAAPGEELHRFHNEQMRGLGVHLLGRRLYETMVYWETVDKNTAAPEHAEFAEIWQALPKIVFSTTLESVQGNATLRRNGLVEEIARLKREPGDDISVGGPGLAAGAIAAGLVDEYRVFVFPVVLGGGTPFFPPLERTIELEPVDTRTFGSGVTYLRYRAA